MAKRKRQKHSILTVKEVRDFLAQFEPDQAFFVPSVQGDNSIECSNTAFYRRIYDTLLPQFKKNTTTSISNSKKIQKITGSGLDNISPDIILWREAPQTFWEDEAKPLPRYSSLDKINRLAGFITRAVSLESEAKKQQVQKRFVAVSTYRFFTKIIPTTNSVIAPVRVRKFLQMIRLSEHSIEVFLDSCVAILQRGQRCSAFCETLSPKEGKYVDYGLLFDPELPDNL